MAPLARSPGAEVPFSDGWSDGRYGIGFSQIALTGTFPQESAVSMRASARLSEHCRERRTHETEALLYAIGQSETDFRCSGVGGELVARRSSGHRHRAHELSIPTEHAVVAFGAGCLVRREVVTPHLRPPIAASLRGPFHCSEARTLPAARHVAPGCSRRWRLGEHATPVVVAF